MRTFKREFCLSILLLAWASALSDVFGAVTCGEMRARILQPTHDLQPTLIGKRFRTCADHDRVVFRRPFGFVRRETVMRSPLLGRASGLLSARTS